MTRLYSEEEVIARVSALTPGRLVAYREARIVVPMTAERGEVYEGLDLARLELACELNDHYEAEAEAIGLMISLIDQLHGVRAELRALMHALEHQPEDVRRRVADVIRKARFGG
ncbi:hypothetical protein ACFORG_00540 [Lutimaribacter marinistellae]|uniref:Chaperone modulatory protein CbpM n=1 Tax=Lutimaribacter marinistellae TaxID=1820329 RepID=A0ABV7TAF4_9RHOB